jgi:S-(hydroxymethyl)glutathione dehydrogenase/alcohol dehydrogenase
MKIAAAVLGEPNAPFVIEDVELAEPRVGEVLVRMAAAGVCHSDWHLVSGATKHPMPVVAGHEGSGVVEAVGPQVEGIAPGDHVVLCWAPSCGRCRPCLDNKPYLCQTFTPLRWAGVLLDGSTRLSRGGAPLYHFCALGCFAARVVVRQESCVVIRRQVPLEVAALVGCAVSTGAGAVLNTAAVRPGQSLVVVGCGGVGLSAVLGAHLAGAWPVVAVDKSEQKLNIARQLGATHAVASGPAAAAAVREITTGGADHVIEAVGAPALQEQALEMLGPGGTLTLCGLAPGDSAMRFPPARLVREELTVRGCYYGSCIPRRDFPRLLELFLAGRLDLPGLISRYYRLEQINEAFAAMLAGDSARGVIVFD